jgi:hypothetical protein
MAETTSTDKASLMMAVLEEIAAGSEGLIRDWPLLSEAREAVAKGGAPELVRFYTARVHNPGSRSVWIAAVLKAHGKKTLESEYQRFMALAAGDDRAGS